MRVGPLPRSLKNGGRTQKSTVGRTSWYHFFTDCLLIPLPCKHSMVYWDPELYLRLLCRKPSILQNTLPRLLCSPPLNTHCSHSALLLSLGMNVPSLFLTCLMQFPAPVTPDVRSQHITPLQADLILLRIRLNKADFHFHCRDEHNSWQRQVINNCLLVGFLHLVYLPYFSKQDLDQSEHLVPTWVPIRCLGRFRWCSLAGGSTSLWRGALRLKALPFLNLHLLVSEDVSFL